MVKVKLFSFSQEFLISFIMMHFPHIHTHYFISSWKTYSKVLHSFFFFYLNYKIFIVCRVEVLIYLLLIIQWNFLFLIKMTFLKTSIPNKMGHSNINPTRIIFSRALGKISYVDVILSLDCSLV